MGTIWTFSLLREKSDVVVIANVVKVTDTGRDVPRSSTGGRITLLHYRHDFFFLNGYLPFAVAQSGRTQALTVLVGSIGEGPAFGLGLSLFAAMLWVVGRQCPRGGWTLLENALADPHGHHRGIVIRLAGPAERGD